MEAELRGRTPDRVVRLDGKVGVLITFDSEGLRAAAHHADGLIVLVPQVGEVGTRRLDNGCVRDAAGQLRLFFRTPKWEDFIGLAVTEIRLYGAGSIQIARRLRSMLQGLIESLPSQRHPPLIEQLDLLQRSVERSFADKEDWTNAGAGDRQGQGSAPELGAAKAGGAHEHDHG